MKTLNFGRYTRSILDAGYSIDFMGDAGDVLKSVSRFSRRDHAWKTIQKFITKARANSTPLREIRGYRDGTQPIRVMVTASGHVSSISPNARSFVDAAIDN